jgi:hypothetical protein
VNLVNCDLPQAEPMTQDFCILCGCTQSVFFTHGLQYLDTICKDKVILPGIFLSKRLNQMQNRDAASHLICMSCSQHMKRMRRKFMMPLDMFLEELIYLNSNSQPITKSYSSKGTARLLDVRCRKRFVRVMREGCNVYFHSLPMMLQNIIRADNITHKWWATNLHTEFFTSSGHVFEIRQHLKKSIKNENDIDIKDEYEYDFEDENEDEKKEQHVLHAIKQESF